MRRLRESVLETDEILLIPPPLISFGVFFSWKTPAHPESDRSCAHTALLLLLLYYRLSVTWI